MKTMETMTTVEEVYNEVVRTGMRAERGEKSWTEVERCIIEGAIQIARIDGHDAEWVRENISDVCADIMIKQDSERAKL